MQTGDVVQGGPWDGFEVISTYSRARAIEDGELVDVSELAREAGIKYPVAVSRGVYGVLDPKSGPAGQGQSFAGRAWDMLQVMLWAIRAGQTGRRVDFTPLFLMGARARRPRGVRMYALCGPGDTPAPVITVMLPEED